MIGLILVIVPLIMSIYNMEVYTVMLSLSLLILYVTGAMVVAQIQQIILSHGERIDNIEYTIKKLGRLKDLDKNEDL